MLFKIAANLIASLLMFALVMGLVWLLNGETRRQARIRAAGLTAWASLVSMHQTRTFTGGRFVMELVLDVEAASGSPTRCTLRETIDAGWNLRPGDRVQVYINPQNVTDIVLDKIMSPRYATENQRGV